MNKFVSLRSVSPALLDLTAFSCRTTRYAALQHSCFKTSAQLLSADNKDIKVNPLFLNRNPRALEFMGLEPKRKGWKFQAPRKDFYHKLFYDKDHARAYVEHCSGKIVIEASTQEPAVAKHLYSLTDVSANRNVGLLLARRMLEAGITSVFCDQLHVDSSSKKKQAFLQALKENAIELAEPEEIQHEHLPGINYDGYNRLGEDKKYQYDYQKIEKDDKSVMDGPVLEEKVSEGKAYDTLREENPAKYDKSFRTA